MRTRFFALAAKLLAATFSLLVGATNFSFADATVPTADIDGASDNALVKRYEGSFIVSYEKLAYT
ncbi:hypothetical protein, partial [Serratia marcescens]